MSAEIGAPHRRETLGHHLYLCLDVVELRLQRGVDAFWSRRRRRRSPACALDTSSLIPLQRVQVVDDVSQLGTPHRHQTCVGLRTTIRLGQG